MQELIFNTDKPITVFNEFKAQLAELKALNSSVVFDYASPEGNKAARSHIYKFRQAKSAIEEKRKLAKKASLDYGKKVDEIAHDLTDQIEEMIDVHARPIKEIEDREKQRIAKCERWINDIKDFLIPVQDRSAEMLKKDLINLESIKPDKESLCEYFSDAVHAYKNAHEYLIDAIEKRRIYEAEQEELEQLRLEKAERDRRDNEERIAREAAEKARLDAEEKANLERDRLIKEKEAAERAAIQAAENAKREQEAAEKKKIADEQKRREDEAHKQRIDTAICQAIIHHAGPVNGGVPQKIIDAINEGKIPNVAIKY